MDKYQVNRSKGYPILGGGFPKIDTTAEYFVVAYAKAFGNRPIISRCDGKSFEGETRWIVDHHNLIPLKDKRDDHWRKLNKKQQLIVTDLMRKHPYTRKGNRSYTRLYDFEGGYYRSISDIWISKDFLEDIFQAMESDERFKTFGFSYDTDTKLYQFEINNYKGDCLSSSEKRLIDAVINTTYQMLINMKEGAE